MTRRPSRNPIQLTHTVFWQSRAINDLELIHAFIAEQAPGPAAAVRDHLRAAAQTLEFFPERGVILRGATRKIVILDRYVLRYRIVGETVRVLRVRDGRRR